MVGTLAALEVAAAALDEAAMEVDIAMDVIMLLMLAGADDTIILLLAGAIEEDIIMDDIMDEPPLTGEPAAAKTPPAGPPLGATLLSALAAALAKLVTSASLLGLMTAFMPSAQWVLTPQ